MNDEQIKTAVRHIVSELYVPKVMDRVVPFVNELKGRVAYETALSTIVGRKVSAFPETTVLDLREPEEYLIKTLTEFIIVLSKNATSRN